MQLAVMAYSFAQSLSRGEIDVPTIIRELAELGIGAVELTDAYVDDENLPAIQATLASTGSQIVCYDIASDFAQSDSGVSEATLARVRRGFERANQLGAHQVMLIPAPPPPGVSPDLARARFGRGLRECLPEAARRGLVTSIENLGGQALVCGKSEQILAIADAAGPDLRITFDAGNFLLADEDPLAALEHLFPRVIHVHLKDWQIVPTRDRPAPGEYRGLDGRSFRGAALGEGVVDLAAIVTRLRTRGYDGYVSVEYEGLEDPRAAVRRGVAYARTLLGGSSTMG